MNHPRDCSNSNFPPNQNQSANNLQKPQNKFEQFTPNFFAHQAILSNKDWIKTNITSFRYTFAQNENGDSIHFQPEK